PRPGSWREPGRRPTGDHHVRPRRAGEHAPGQGSRRGPRRDGRPDRPVLRDHLGRRDRHRPPRHRVPARGLVQRRRRHRAGQPHHPARQGRPPRGARMSTTPAERLGAGRYLAAGGRPESAVTSVHELTTADGATIRGVLATVPGATTVVSLMHPRQDLTHHPLVPLLLQAGAAVWTQLTRSARNDPTLVPEQATLDAAAGLVYLRERGFGSIVTLGHSGGG